MKIFLMLVLLSLLVASSVAFTTVIRLNTSACASLSSILVPLFPILGINGTLADSALATLVDIVTPMISVFPAPPFVGCNLDIFLMSLVPYLHETLDGLACVPISQYEEVCYQVGVNIGAVIQP